MRGGHHLHEAAGKIEAAVAAAVDHALEFLRHLSRPEMAHLDVEPAMRRGAPRLHLRVHGAADDVAGGALELFIIIAHEALHRAIEEMAARAAQSLLQHRAGHAGVRPCQQSGRMELDHLHVAQGQARAQRHRQPIHALVAGGGMVTIHGWSAASREQHRLRRDEAERAGANVDHQHAGKHSVARGNERHRAVLLEPTDRPRPYLLHQAIDDLDAGEVALVHGTVEALAGKRLAVQRAVGIAIEEAADLVLELAHALDRGAYQRPGQFLMRQPFAALDRVHEMALDRVPGVERDVVAALHHARAAAFSEQPLGRNGDVEIGIRLERMQRREQAGAPGAENQNIRLKTFDIHASITTCAPAG